MLKTETERWIGGREREKEEEEDEHVLCMFTFSLFFFFFLVSTGIPELKRLSTTGLN